MKNLLLIAGVLCSTLIFGGCNTSGEKEENKNSSDEAKEQTTEALGEKEASVEVSEQYVNTSEASQASEDTPSSEATKDKEPFDYLDKLEVDEDIVVKYNSASSEVFNKNVTELKKDDPFYPEYPESPAGGNIKLLKTQIAPGGSYYYVVFSWGPSADPAFLFYEEGTLDKLAFSFSGMRLFIPGNGNLYVDGHSNNLFNTRLKWKLVNGDAVEVEQPFYFVGLKSETRKPAKIYKTEQLSEVVASMPENYSVEVLINKPGTNLFLVRTDFGLCGWLEISGEDAFGGLNLIEGLYYAGD